MVFVHLLQQAPQYLFDLLYILHKKLNCPLCLFICFVVVFFLVSSCGQTLMNWGKSSKWRKPNAWAVPIPKTAMFLSFICQNIEFIFPLPKYLDCLPFFKKLRSSSFFQKVEVVFLFFKNWGCLPLAKILKVIFYLLKIEFVFDFQRLRLPSFFQKIEVIFHFWKNGGRLSFMKRLRLSSI